VIDAYMRTLNADNERDVPVGWRAINRPVPDLLPKFAGFQPMMSSAKVLF
jgi:hypothetical protein